MKYLAKNTDYGYLSSKESIHKSTNNKGNDLYVSFLIEIIYLHFFFLTLNDSSLNTYSSHCMTAKGKVAKLKSMFSSCRSIYRSYL